MKKILVGTLCGVLLTTSMYAGDNRSGFYLGAGIGSANYNDNELSVLIAGTEVEKTTNGFKGYLGYQFNNVIGIELGYSDYGKNEATAPGNNYSYAAQSYSVAANLGYSFMDSQIRPFVLLGAAYIQTKHENMSPFYTSIRDAGAAVHYGVGLQYEPNILKGLGFRIAYEADTYATAIEGTSSETYKQTSSLVYGAIQYKF